MAEILIYENSMTEDELRHAVTKQEEVNLQLPQVHIETGHMFAHKLAARIIRIPAGITLTGAIHKFENMNVLLQGEMEISTLTGQELIKAPMMFVSPPGIKRIAITKTECIWVTFCGTEETDPDKIEEEMTAKNEQEYLKHCAALNLLVKG